MDELQPLRAPVAPNECKIRGTLTEVERGPEDLGFIWKVTVDETDDVNNLPNFARTHVGNSISIYVHPEMKQQLKAGNDIEAHVFFQGDEQGGAFFLANDDVRKL